MEGVSVAFAGGWHGLPSPFCSSPIFFFLFFFCQTQSHSEHGRAHAGCPPPSLIVGISFSERSVYDCSKALRTGTVPPQSRIRGTAAPGRGGDFSGGPEPLRSLCLLALPSIHSSFHPSVSPSVRPSIYPSIHPRGRAQHPTEPHARSPLPTAGTTPALVPPSFPRGLPAAPAPLGRSRRGGTTPPQRNPRIGGRCAAPLAAKGPGAVPGPGGRLPRTPRT